MDKHKYGKVILGIWVIFWSSASIIKFFINIPEDKNALGEFFGISGLALSLTIGLLPAIAIYVLVKWYFRRRAKKS